jgi:hypothetical protein
MDSVVVEPGIYKTPIFDRTAVSHRRQRRDPAAAGAVHAAAEGLRPVVAQIFNVPDLADHPASARS